MTKIEELLHKKNEEPKEGEPAKVAPTFGELIAAIVEDLVFLNRRLNNAEVALAKTLKEFQRVKNRQLSFSEDLLGHGNEPK